MIFTMMALALGLGALESSSASAVLSTSGLLASLTQSETTTGQTNRYQYDALGRLVEVTTEVQGAVQTHVAYAYDPAGNRTQQTTVSSAPSPAARTRVVVLPLAGFTIIPIRTNP
jgi:YD repeat-containing protein